jgi:hypothetical protein
VSSATDCAKALSASAKSVNAAASVASSGFSYVAAERAPLAAAVDDAMGRVQSSAWCVWIGTEWLYRYSNIWVVLAPEQVFNRPAVPPAAWRVSAVSADEAREALAQTSPAVCNEAHWYRGGDPVAANTHCTLRDQSTRCSGETLAPVP